MSDPAVIQRQIDELRALQAEEQEKIWREQTLPAIRASVGSTWVYRNNRYSSKGCWDQFRMLVAVRDEPDYCQSVFLECFIDSEKRAFLQHHLGYLNRYNSTLADGGWQTCPQGEYETEYYRVCEALGVKP